MSEDAEPDWRPTINLADMTAPEMVRALSLRIGDTIETRLDYDGGEWTEVRRQLLAVGKTHCLWDSWNKTSAMPRWIHHGENCLHLYDAPWRKTASDPSLDPLTPLREEMREAYELLSDVRHGIRPPFMEVDVWLNRNAAFGPGKGEGK